MRKTDLAAQRLLTEANIDAAPIDVFALFEVALRDGYIESRLKEPINGLLQVLGVATCPLELGVNAF